MADAAGAAPPATPTPAQERDPRGCFLPRDGRPRARPSRSRVGIRGTSHFAYMSKLNLARTLVRLELDLARLSAELEGRAWEMPVARVPPNMGGIRKLQQESVRKLVEALEEVLDGMALDRMDKKGAEIARRMAVALKAPFRVERLYRKPLDTMWRAPKDFCGAHKDIDHLPRMTKCLRMTGDDLRYHIRRTSSLLEAARERRRVQLLAEAQEEDWTPLVVVRAALEAAGSVAPAR